MAFLSGLNFASLGALQSPEMLKAALSYGGGPKGLFGTDVTGGQLAAGLGDLAGAGGGNEPLRHAQFARLQPPPMPQFAPLPNYQGNQLPPLDLAHYFQQLGNY